MSVRGKQPEFSKMLYRKIKRRPQYTQSMDTKKNEKRTHACAQTRNARVHTYTQTHTPTLLYITIETL